MKKSDLQVEDGNFTRIVNPLIEALVKFPFKGCELAICVWILRQTYGYQKKEDSISLTQFEKALQRTRPTIVRALKNLQLVNIVKLVKRGTSKKHGNTYTINKYSDTWGLVKGVKLVKKKGSQLVKGSLHTKEIYKRNIPATLKKPNVADNKPMRTIDDRKFDSDYTPRITEDGEPVEVSRKGVGAAMKDLLKWAERRRGFKFSNVLKQYTAMKRMRMAKISPSVIQDRWIEFEDDKFWATKGFDFADIANSLDKRR